MRVTKMVSSVVLALPLLGGSLLMNTGLANAAQCPVGSHWNDFGGGTGYCAPDASGGGDGGDTGADLGGHTPSPEATAPVTPTPDVSAAPVTTPTAPAPTTPNPDDSETVVADPAPIADPAPVNPPIEAPVITPVVGAPDLVAAPVVITAPEKPAVKPTPAKTKVAAAASKPKVAVTVPPSATPSPSTTVVGVNAQASQSAPDSEGIDTALVWTGIGLVLFGLATGTAGVVMFRRAAAAQDKELGRSRS